MDDAASRAFVQDQVERLRQCSEVLLIEEVRTENWDVFVILTRKKDGKKYVVRLRCDDGYPLTAPSVVFVSPADYRSEGPQFWPDDREQAFKRSQNPPFICVPGIREYHQRHQNIPFSTKDVGLSKIITELVTMMNK